MNWGDQMSTQDLTKDDVIVIAVALRFKMRIALDFAQKDVDRVEYWTKEAQGCLDTYNRLEGTSNTFPDFKP
jgi:hypothetical protein